MGILKMPRLRQSILFKVMVMVSICLQMLVIYSLHLQNTEIVLQDTQSHFTYRELLNLPQKEDDWRRKSLMFNINKTEHRFLTIGIPTVRRQVSNYFMKTLDSLVNCTSKEQFSEIFIVILLADFNVTWRLEMASMIKDRYTPLVTNGAIQVIEAPREFYPPLDNLQHTYNDSRLKRKWRSKQNVDYAFLWLYSKDLSKYYMQIEDDIFTVPGYINIIKQFISIQNGDWTCLEFGELGFIGKLYPTKYLERLAKTVLLFYEEQPVDVTFFHFNILNLQTQRIIRRPTIFQHVGYYSSLPGKIQTLTDKYFPDNVQKVVKGDNPPAKIVTTFRTSPEYPPEAAYSANNGYFWAQSPANMHDTIHVLFNEPVIIDKVIILTGSKGHPYDKIYNAKLDVCLSVRRIFVFQIQCINEIYIGTFVNGTIEELNLATRLHNMKVESLRITMTKSQEFWILVKEIAVFVKPQLGMNLHFPVNAQKALRKQIFKQIHLPVDIENIRKSKLFNREAFGINR